MSETSKKLDYDELMEQIGLVSDRKDTELLGEVNEEEVTNPI